MLEDLHGVVCILTNCRLFFPLQPYACFIYLKIAYLYSEPDDVVLSYIMEAIDLVINDGGDAMDVDEFVEIMTAYIPELITVERLQELFK